MDPVAALRVFREVCDLPAAERDSALAALEPSLAAWVRRMLDADSTDDLALSETAGMVTRAARELESDEAETTGLMPQTIGPYRVVERLGGGSTSHVYLAWQAAPRRLIALKIVRRGVPEQVAARFHEEAQALADLRLAAAPQVYDVGVHQGRAWLAMERVEGTPLRAWAKGRRADTVAALVAEVADAVQRAHDAGLVHHDLKPDHVFVDRAGRPRLLDFGLAGADGEGLGTPAYMPPESLDGDTVGAATDTYALGVTLIEVLHGGLPATWTHPTGGAPRRPPPLDHVDPELRAVALRAVSDRPEDRYASAGAFAADLVAMVRGEPVSALPAGRWRSLRLLVRRRRGLLQQVGRVAAWALVGALMVGLARAHLQRLDHEARQAQAARLAANLDATLVALHAAGRPDEARRWLDLVKTTPDLVGTASLAEVWLAEGTRLGDVGTQRAAWVEASAHPSTRAAALEQLAASFHRGGQPTSLRRVHELLDGAAWRDEVALWSRELAAPVAGPLAPMVARLALGTPTAHHAQQAAVGQIDGRPSALLVERSPGFAVVTELDPALSLRRALRPDGAVDPVRRPGVLRRGEQPWLVTSLATPPGGLGWVDPSTERSAILGVIPAAYRWSEARTHAGPARLYVGTAGSNRALYWARPGESAVEQLHATRGSDFNALATADITGDGLDELIAAVGPWQAYEVQVYTAAGDGLRVLDRMELGNVDDVVVLDRPDGTKELVVVKSNRYPNYARFGDRAPYGEPAGMYFLRVDGGELAVRAFVPIPMAAPEPVAGFTELAVADLDGDGWDEVYAEVRHDHDVLLWAVHPDHVEDAALIAGIGLLAPADVDADGADELIVSLPDRDDQTWVLGAGDHPVPALQRAADRVALLDPALVIPGLELAARFADLGLFDEAIARAQRSAAGLGGSERQAVLRWVAQLNEAVGRSARAAEAWQVAAEAGDATAWAEVLRCAERARDAARVRLARRSLEVAPDGRVGEGTVDLLAGPEVWAIAAPEAVRRWSQGSVDLDVFGSHGDVLRTELTPGGELFQVEVEAELVDLDPYGSFSVAVLRGGADAAHAMLVGGSGGGRANLRVHCGKDDELGPTQELEALPMTGPARLRMRVAVDIRAGVAASAMDRGPGSAAMEASYPIPDGGAWTLVVRAQSGVSPGSAEVAASRARVRLLRAELVGADARGGQPADDPAQAWARGDARAAAAGFARTSPWLASYFWYELGDPAAARGLVKADPGCCLLHRLHRLQPWGVGAEIAAAQTSAERLRFLSESAAPGPYWPAEMSTFLMEDRLDSALPANGEELFLWIRRAEMIRARGHPLRAEALLRRVLVLPLADDAAHRADMSAAALGVARMRRAAGDVRDAAAWVGVAIGIAELPERAHAMVALDPSVRDLVPPVIDWPSELSR